MSERELPRSQDEFFSAYAVESFFQAKQFAVDEIQAQAIIDTLKELGKLNKNIKLGNLLDVGCGSGIATSLIGKHFDNVIGIDLSANQIQKACDIGHPHHVHFKVGNGEFLPVADGSIDVITSIFSIQHLDICRFLRECRRVLKPGGVAICYTAYLSKLESLVDNKLPPIVDEFGEIKARSIEIARATCHPDRFLWDDFQALHNLIDWPTKRRRIHRKATTVSTLSKIRNAYLSLPFYAELGTTADNPVIHAFQKIECKWKLEPTGDKDMDVRVFWNATVLVLL